MLVALSVQSFSSAPGLPSRRNLDLDDLRLLLSDASKRKDDPFGRLLIVEDLSTDVIETLGSLLNIDPFFFASHIDAFEPDIATARHLRPLCVYNEVSELPESSLSSCD